MLHLPKKTYSRRNKANKKIGSKRSTKVQIEKRNLDVDQTLPEDIWKDSFDRLKDLDSIPTPRNHSSNRVISQRKDFSKEWCGINHSFVSTPKTTSKELEEYPIPFSPIESRKYFLSNDYYDSRGNPRKLFEYSSEIGQELLQSICALEGTNPYNVSDKTKSRAFLSQGSKTKTEKLRDKTNLNNSSRLKPISRFKFELNKLCSLTETEQVSLKDTKHMEKENINFARRSCLMKESMEGKTKDVVIPDSSRKSRQKRQLKKRQKPQRGSRDHLNKQPSKETTPTRAKRSKQIITPEVDFATVPEPLSSDYLSKQSLKLNETGLSSATSIRKSKQKRRKKHLKSKINSLGNLSKLSDWDATSNKNCTEISQTIHLVCLTDASEPEQLTLKNKTKSESGEIRNIERTTDYPGNPSSSNKDIKSSQFEIIRNVDDDDDDNSFPSSQKTSFKTKNSRKSDTVNTKKSRTQRKSRKVNRYLPLPFVEIISGKKLGQETIVISDDSLPIDALEEIRRKTTGNKRKSVIETANDEKPHDLELCDQTKTEEEVLSHWKEAEISLKKTSSYENLRKEDERTTSGKDPNSNESLVVGVPLNHELNDRMSFVTRRTRDRQSLRRKRNDPVLSNARETIDINPENTCIEDTSSAQPEKNKVKWDISDASNKETAKNSSNLLNASLNSSISMQEFLSAINRTTTMAERSKGRSTAQNKSPVAKLSVVLQPGKWRKSLNIWRRLNATYKDRISDTEIPAPNCLFPNTTLMRAFCGEPFNNSLATATDQRASTRLGFSCIYRRKTIVDYEKSTLVLKEGEDIFNIKESAAEDDCDTSIKCNESALLLEPTDDESPNQSTLPHLTSISKQNVCTSLRRSQTVCYKDLCSPRDTEYSNETSNERAQRYQHQLSVPLPLYRQPSISRRRRTSIVGLPVPSIGGPICEDELFTEFVRLSTYEVSLRAQLDAKDIVLRRCGQSEPLNFADEYSEKALHQCRKIGEGVYGEVFMNKNFTGETVVLKIIPIEGCIEINGESQKRFDEILSEIVIAMELSRLRNDKEYTTSGFVEVKKVRCVKGRYPDYLLELWELFRENHGTENDNPEIFPEDQLYIVLELANGGQDLEAFTFQNALQSYSAFVQVALTIAAAERKFQFEHRDLHWGNILLAPTEEKELSFRIAGKEINIPTHGVKATIIDYTLSRMVFDGCCLYNDLSNDNELFSAGGDYQFDIYRFMRKRLEDQWERFEPYTNVLWLHYAIDKMISGARYRCSKSKKHRAAIHDMMQLRDEMLDFKSASDYIECLN